MTDEIKEYINSFYEDITQKYSEYHNKVTTTNIPKIFFSRKQNTKEIAQYYMTLRSNLNMLIEKVKKCEITDFVNCFLSEMKLFKEILNIEINIYEDNENIPMDQLKKLSKLRLDTQNKFLEFDSRFRTIVISLINNN